jgi:hypothetical protein
VDGISLRRAAAGSGLVVAIGLGGCSADEVTRTGAAPAGGAAAAQQAPPPIPPITPGLQPVPDPLPPDPPGTVLADDLITASDFGFAVDAHQVLHLSTDRFGAPIAVSATVLVPTGVPAPPGGRGVVAWAHGTVGLVDCSTPSLRAQQGGGVNDPASTVGVQAILAAGHIVTASDYPGLGTPGVHPYLDGVGEGRAVLDSIRAAAAYGGTGPAVVVGFSQGSQAAIFAGAEQPGYAPEVDLRAIVPIGVPSRFGLAFGARDLPVVQGYLRHVLAGIVAARPDLDRSLILTPSGEDAYDAFAAGADLPPGPVDPTQGCATFDVEWDEDLRADPMTVPSWRAAFEDNLPGKRPVPVPVLVVQSEADEQALAFLADEVCRDLEARGADIRMWRYDDESHGATVGVSADDRTTWVLDRLAGRALTDDVPFTGEQPQVLPTCPAAQATPDPDDPDPDDPSDPSAPGGGSTAPPATAVTGPARFTG